jgi:hypothetical protein
MLTATLPSRLHTLRSFLWRAHNIRQGEGSARRKDSANLTRNSHDHVTNHLTCTHFANVTPYSPHISRVVTSCLRLLRWSSGLYAGLWYTDFAGSNPAEFVGFFGHLKNPPHASLRRGSERICPMSQLCGM